MNLEFVRRLAIPMEVKEMYPLTAEMERTFQERDIQIKKILSGQDDRLLLIIGPCSADRQDSVLDYMGRLREAQEKVADRILMKPAPQARGTRACSTSRTRTQGRICSRASSPSGSCT